MASPSARVRLTRDSDGDWRATCRRCTWTTWHIDLIDAHEAGVEHVPECGRVLGPLTPATFTRCGDSSTMSISTDYWSEWEVWA